MTDERSPSAAAGPDWDAIGRYLAGESSAPETEAVRAWLAAQPADAELLARLDSAIASVATRPAPRVDVEAALRQVRARRSDTPVVSRTLHREVPKPRQTMRWRVLGIPALAAAAAIIVAVVTLWRLRAVTDDVAPTFAARTIETTIGQRDSLQLPDGSVIHVGPRSRLTVASYTSDRREVNLDGEAFFDVKHDAARPFVVRAGPAIVQDVGTAFLVDQIDTATVRVVVTSGIVTLRGVSDAPDSAAELHAGDIGELQPPPRRRVEVQRRAATPDDIAWTRGRLVFREATLERVRTELRRWYGVDLQIADASLAGRHLNAEFAGEPLDQVLRTIALALGADVERRGDTAIVRASRRGTNPQ